MRGKLCSKPTGRMVFKPGDGGGRGGAPCGNPHSKIDIDPGDDGDFLFIDPPYDKDISLSTAEKLLYGFYRQAEAKLADLPRRGHKKQAKSIWPLPCA